MPSYRELAVARVWVQREFLGIPDDHFRVTSDPAEYNCISWPADDTKRWWWPAFGRFWPGPPVPFTDTVAAFIAAFQTKNYQPCAFDTTIEPGYDKVVIYATVFDEVKHMARQILDSEWSWTSKLGPGYDISHKELSDIQGPQYGHAVQMLKRPKRPSLVKPTGKRRRR